MADFESLISDLELQPFVLQMA